MASIKAQNEGLAKIEEQKAQAALQDQQFQIKKIDMEWYSAFTVKWGKTPDVVLGLQDLPQAQQQAVQQSSPLQPPSSVQPDQQTQQATPA